MRSLPNAAMLVVSLRPPVSEKLVSEIRPNFCVFTWYMVYLPTRNYLLRSEFSPQ